MNNSFAYLGNIKVLKMDQNKEQKEILITKLSELRKSKGISQIEISRKINCRFATINDIENLKSNPRIETLIAYALALGYKFDLKLL